MNQQFIPTLLLSALFPCYYPPSLLPCFWIIYFSIKLLILNSASPWNIPHFFTSLHFFFVLKYYFIVLYPFFVLFLLEWFLWCILYCLSTRTEKWLWGGKSFAVIIVPTNSWLFYWYCSLYIHYLFSLLQFQFFSSLSRFSYFIEVFFFSDSLDAFLPSYFVLFPIHSSFIILFISYLFFLYFHHHSDPVQSMKY